MKNPDGPIRRLLGSLRRRPGRRVHHRRHSRAGWPAAIERLENRTLLSGTASDDIHALAHVDVPFGVFTADEIAAFENVAVDSSLSSKTSPAVAAYGIHASDVLTFVLDFKETTQGSTFDIFGNEVSTFDVTSYGFAASAFDTVANAILAEVEEDYFDELIGTVAGPAGQDLEIDFLIGDIGTAPVGVSEYYYVQVGTGVAGPHSGEILGVAGNDTITGQGVAVTATTYMNTGSGNDTVDFDGLHAKSVAILILGADHDAARFLNSRFDNVVNMPVTAGNNVMDLQNTTFNGPTHVQTSGGALAARIRNNTFNSNVFITGGPGNTDILLDDLTSTFAVTRGVSGFEDLTNTFINESFQTLPELAFS